MPGTPTSITAILARAERGDASALDELAPLLYDRLRAMAAAVLQNAPRNQTLRTTALVNEAFIKLVGIDGSKVEGETHFFGIAAKTMRSILVDYARVQQTAKRGGGARRLQLDEVIRGFESMDVDILELNEALDRLGELDERKAKVVELRFFGGLSVERTADLLGVTPRTVDRDWRMARAWLCKELLGEE